MNTELDVRQVFLILRRRLWLIVLLTVVFGVGTFAISKYMITPQYSATASMYVYNETNPGSTSITSTDLTTSQKLVQTYIVILSSDSVLDKVVSQLDYKYTTEQIRKMLTASSINDTEAFSISITNTDPEAAQRIVNTIAEIAPDEIIRVVKAGSVEIIDKATLPTRPSSPNVLRNTAVGALIGMALAVTIAILSDMFDTVIHTEDDLTENFTIPVLGIIPTMDGTEDEKGGRHHAKSAEKA